MSAVSDVHVECRALRVLVVEDALVHQKLATSLLKKQGHSVTVVSNGKEAIDALEAEEFSLVFMDVEMPVMDGLVATGVIRDRESKTNTHTPIIALTATTDPQKCLAAGMDAYIPKPLRAESLREVMGQVLENRACPAVSTADSSGIPHQCAVVHG